MLLDGGRVGREQIVPKEQIDDLLRSRNEGHINEKSNVWGVVPPSTGYRSFFWSYANDDPNKPFLHALGLNGQHCLVDPVREAVIVKFSANPDMSLLTNDIVALTSLSRLIPDLAG